MKKKIALILCLAVMTLVFTGCGRDKVVGEWELDSMIIDGMTWDLDELREYYGDYTGTITLTFYDDGSFMATSYSYYSADEDYGTWEKTGKGSYIVYIDGEPLYISFEGKLMVLDDGYDTMYFTRI